VAVIITTEQFRGVSYACDSLASWCAAQRDCYRGFVWRVLAERVLRNRPSRVVEIEISSRAFSSCTLSPTISEAAGIRRPIKAWRVVHGRGPTSASGVRRGKAALYSGCKSHPAIAPAGSSRSSYGGDEIAEAFGMRVTNW
jgi:hypothetical protein